MRDSFSQERRLGDQFGQASATEVDAHSMLDQAQATFREMDETEVAKYTTLRQQFSKKKRSLGIDGSAALIRAFQEINGVKIDYLVPLEDISIIDFPESGVTGKRELKFELLNLDHTSSDRIGTTIYDARKQLLQKTFKANVHYEELFKEDEVDFATDSLKQLFNRHKDKQYRFRFLVDEVGEEENWYLRAVVDKSQYHPYDNGMVLFMGLMAVSEYARQADQQFYVESAVLKDSQLRVQLKSKKEIKLKNHVSVRIGVSIRNSELGDEAAEFTLTYWVTYNHKTVALVDEPIFKINHGYRVEKNANRVKNLSRIGARTDEISQAIQAAKVYDPMSAGSIERLFSSLITSTQKLPESYRRHLSSMKSEVLRNSYSLLELFDKLETLAAESNSDEVIWEIQARLGQFVMK